MATVWYSVPYTLHEDTCRRWPTFMIGRRALPLPLASNTQPTSDAGIDTRRSLRWEPREIRSLPCDVEKVIRQCQNRCQSQRSLRWALLPYGASHDTALRPGSMKHSDSISDDDGSRPAPTIQPINRPQQDNN